MLTEIELVDEIKFHINAGLLDVKQHFKGKFPQKHLDVVLSAGEEERELFRCLGEDVIRGCLTDIIFDAFPTVQSKNTLTVRPSRPFQFAICDTNNDMILWYVRKAANRSRRRRLQGFQASSILSRCRR